MLGRVTLEAHSVTEVTVNMGTAEEGWLESLLGGSEVSAVGKKLLFLPKDKLQALSTPATIARILKALPPGDSEEPSEAGWRLQRRIMCLLLAVLYRELGSNRVADGDARKCVEDLLEFCERGEGYPPYLDAFLFRICATSAGAARAAMELEYRVFAVSASILDRIRDRRADQAMDWLSHVARGVEHLARTISRGDSISDIVDIVASVCFVFPGPSNPDARGECPSETEGQTLFALACTVCKIFAEKAPDSKGDLIEALGGRCAKALVGAVGVASAVGLCFVVAGSVAACRDHEVDDAVCAVVQDAMDAAVEAVVRSTGLGPRDVLGKGEERRMCSLAVVLAFFGEDGRAGIPATRMTASMLGVRLLTTSLLYDVASLARIRSSCDDAWTKELEWMVRGGNKLFLSLAAGGAGVVARYGRRLVDTEDRIGRVFVSETLMRLVETAQESKALCLMVSQAAQSPSSEASPEGGPVAKLDADMSAVMTALVKVALKWVEEWSGLMDPSTAVRALQSMASLEFWRKDDTKGYNTAWGVMTKSVRSSPEATVEWAKALGMMSGVRALQAEVGPDPAPADAATSSPPRMIEAAEAFSGLAVTMSLLREYPPDTLVGTVVPTVLRLMRHPNVVVSARACDAYGAIHHLQLPSSVYTIPYFLDQVLPLYPFEFTGAPAVAKRACDCFLSAIRMVARNLVRVSIGVSGGLEGDDATMDEVLPWPPLPDVLQDDSGAGVLTDTPSSVAAGFRPPTSREARGMLLLMFERLCSHVEQLFGTTWAGGFTEPGSDKARDVILLLIFQHLLFVELDVLDMVIARITKLAKAVAGGDADRSSTPRMCQMIVDMVAGTRDYNRKSVLVRWYLEEISPLNPMPRAKL